MKGSTLLRRCLGSLVDSVLAGRRESRRKQIWVFFVAAAASPSAFAYLDPGSGSLMFQTFLALIFGVGMGWRRLREVVVAAWRRRNLRRSKRDGG